jgi:LytS/YehU family sensor histidine kinase
MFAAVLLSSYFNYKTQPFIYSSFGVSPPNLSWNVFFFRSLDNILFNLPTIGGIALAIKLLKYWYSKRREEQQLIISKANAELQLLKAQVHPHFLFNTLNNIYSFILTASPKAPEMIKKLSGLLHYIIYECNQPQVSLEKEFNMLHDYMALEKIRYGEQMDMTTNIQGNYRNKTIAPLLLIPFVENSFKHGTSKMLSRSWVSLNIVIENESLYFRIKNSKPEEYMHSGGKNGIGLSNVQKRLQLLYPGRNELKMTAGPDHFSVLLKLNLVSECKRQESIISKRETYQYEMA